MITYLFSSLTQLSLTLLVKLKKNSFFRQNLTVKSNFRIIKEFPRIQPLSVRNLNNCQGSKCCHFRTVSILSSSSLSDVAMNKASTTRDTLSTANGIRQQRLKKYGSPNEPEKNTKKRKWEYNIKQISILFILNFMNLG